MCVYIFHLQYFCFLVISFRKCLVSIEAIQNILRISFSFCGCYLDEKTHETIIPDVTLSGVDDKNLFVTVFGCSL